MNGEMTPEEAVELAAEGLADVDEACRVLGNCGRTHLYDLMNDGTLPYAEVAGGRKIPRVALKRYAARAIETAAKTPPKGRRAEKAVKS